MKKRKKPIGLIVALVICGGIIVKMTMPQAPPQPEPKSTNDKVPSPSDVIKKKPPTKQEQMKTMQERAFDGPTVLLPHHNEVKVKPDASSVEGQWYTKESHASH